MYSFWYKKQHIAIIIPHQKEQSHLSPHLSSARLHHRGDILYTPLRYTLCLVMKTNLIKTRTDQKLTCFRKLNIANKNFNQH